MAKTPVPKQSRRQQWHAGAPRSAGHDFLTAHGAALKGLRPIADREYVQRGLDLANWDGEDLAAFYRLEERLLVGGEWGAGKTILQPRERDEEDRYSGRFYRDLLLRELSPLLPSPLRLRPREPAKTPLDVQPSFSREQLRDLKGQHAANALYTRRAHGHVAGIRVACEDGGHTTFGWVMRPAHLHDAIDTVMWLLTATDHPIGSELRQCEWKGCFNLFLAEKPKAGPRRRYCQSACMEAMHQHRTPERKAAVKLGLTVDEYRSKQAAKRKRTRVNR
jgi:hypothetical protein